MKTLRNSIERNAAIYCMLRVANEALKANKIILLKLNKLTK